MLQRRDRGTRIADILVFTIVINNCTFFEKNKGTMVQDKTTREMRNEKSQRLLAQLNE